MLRLTPLVSVLQYSLAKGRRQTTPPGACSLARARGITATVTLLGMLLPGQNIYQEFLCRLMGPPHSLAQPSHSSPRWVCWFPCVTQQDSGSTQQGLWA